MTTIPVKYNIADAEIAKMSDHYMFLVVEDEQDKKGFDVVHAARMDVRGKRIAVESTRKELKSSALEYGRTVDSEAKRLTALLEPIEDYLEGQEQVVLVAAERKKKEKEEAAAAKLQKQISQLQAVSGVIDLAELKTISDDEYAGILAGATAAFNEAEAKRKAEKEAAEKLAISQSAERAELAKAQAAAVKAQREADAIKAKAEKAIRDAQEAERAAAAKVQAEKDKAAAIEKAKTETEARIKAEAEAKEKRDAELAKEKAEMIERQKALMPIRERIKGLSNGLEAVLDEYVARNPDRNGIWGDARTIISIAIQKLRDLENGK